MMAPVAETACRVKIEHVGPCLHPLPIHPEQAGRVASRPASSNPGANRKREGQKSGGGQVRRSCAARRYFGRSARPRCAARGCPQHIGGRLVDCTSWSGHRGESWATPEETGSRPRVLARTEASRTNPGRNRVDHPTITGRSWDKFGTLEPGMPLWWLHFSR